MIPFELTYTRAETVEEAVSAWQTAHAAGETALFCGGATELVTLARENKRRFDRLIDYKRIPQAQRFGPDDAGNYLFGAALRLNTLVDAPEIGIVGICARGVADRTVRNSITLGGNICGMLAYREAVLPFLLLDGQVTIAGPAGADATTSGTTGPRAPGGADLAGAGLRTVPIRDIFDRKLALPDGSIVVSFSLDKDVVAGLGGVTSRRIARYGALAASGEGVRGRWYYQRSTRDPRVDYPLVTLATAILDGEMRVAVAGAWGYPVRATGTEDVLNGEGLAAISAMEPATRRELIARAVDAQGLSWKQDMRAGREYRRELTVQAIEDGLASLAGRQEETTR